MTEDEKYIAQLSIGMLIGQVALTSARAVQGARENHNANESHRNACIAELDKRFDALATPGKKLFDAAAIPLPDFIPRAAWVEWCADRKERRKPITERGAKSQIKELARLMMLEGHQPADVIAHSIAGGYQGLFAPKPSTNTEPAWRREQRERTQIAAPGVASRTTATDFFEAEVKNVTPRRLG